MDGRRQNLHHRRTSTSTPGPPRRPALHPRLRRAGNIYEIFVAVAAISLGAYAVNTTGRATRLSGLGRYSLTIYITHMALLKVMTGALEFSGLDFEFITQLALFPFAITVVVVAACIAVHRPFVAYIVNPAETGLRRLATAVLPRDEPAPISQPVQAPAAD